ncbi:MAG: HEAT repeat domain-containing protein [Chloroflexi bacterium]|nr:HEAT repeat domain-containing protein [Chloroflexota bacterium]
MSLDQFLNTLFNSAQPIRRTDLMEFSGMTPEELGLVRRMWQDIDAQRRTELLEQLVEITEDNLEADFNDLFRFCLTDREPEVRARAVEGLWECDDRTLVAPLTLLLQGDPSSTVKAEAALALGKFAILAQMGKMLPKDGERIRQVLLQTVHSQEEDQEVIRRALEAVAPFNTREVQQIIQAAYESDEPKMRHSAVYAMGKSGDPKWLPVIIKEMGSPDPAMRYEATSACGELGEEQAIPHLVQLFQDEDSQIQASAVAAVGAIGGSLARRVLLGCLKSSDDVVAEAAQAALGNMEAGERSISMSFGTYPRPSRRSR